MANRTHIQFLERVEGHPGPRDLGSASNITPWGLDAGNEIELHHRSYRVIRVNPIFNRVDNNFEDYEVTYQVHLERLKNDR